MPIKKAAFKALRQSKKKELKNKKVKLNLNYLIKKSRQAIEKGNFSKAQELVKKTVKVLDKAAKLKIIKKNNASRNKSRLVKKLNSLKKKEKK